jgi:hypothetical protein
VWYTVICMGGVGRGYRYVILLYVSLGEGGGLGLLTTFNGTQDVLAPNLNFKIL